MRVAQPGLWPSTISPAPIQLAEDLHLLRRVLLSPAGSPKLCPNGARLALTDGAGHAWVIDPKCLDAGFEGWQRFALPPGAFRPAFASEPLFVAANGEVSRWMPDLTLRPVWQAQLADVLIDANGLPGDRVLLMAPGKWFFNRRMLNCGAGQVIWKTRAEWLAVFALDDVIVSAARADGALLAIDPKTGRELWRTKTSAVPSPAILGITGDIVWITGNEGSISGLDLATGKKKHSISVAGKVPRGVFDSHGIFHALCGLTYQRLDLGECPQLLMTCAGPSGWPLLVAGCGRMIFRNRKGHLCVFDPRFATGPENQYTLWQGDSPVREAKASDGFLFALDDHSLLCFGPVQ